jgi:heterodisulfide reductase subunit B
MNLDLRQGQAARAVGLESRIPVLYFTQLMGLAFGLEHAHLGFEKLCVSVQPLLDKLRKAREEAAFHSREAAVKAEKPAGKAQAEEVRP